MNRIAVLVLALLLITGVFPILAQDQTEHPAVTLPNTEEWAIHSDIVDQDYKISIALPKNYAASDQVYPVLYALDPEYTFGTIMGVIERADYFGHLPRIIVVGVGYTDEATQEVNLDNIGRVVPHEAANIGLIEGSQIRIHKWRGYPAEINDFISQLCIPLDSPNYRQMLESGEPCLTSNIEQTPDWVVWPELSWIKSYAAAPIKTHGKVIGFLNLDSNTPGFFTDEHVERLQAFADQVAIALENAQLYAEIRRYAEELEQRVMDRTLELEQERAQLQAILEGMGEGVIYTEGFAVRYVNQQLVTLTGYSPDEVTDDVQNLIHKAFPQDLDLAPYFAEIIARLAAQRVWQGTMAVKRRDGSQFEASMTVTLVRKPDDEPLSVVTLIRDISTEKALQDQKDQFIANASHELRTPLANMKMRLYLLKKQPAKAA
ncbi:GAF domain-containing protein, partial [Chloroflexota bacterium]